MDNPPLPPQLPEVLASWSHWATAAAKRRQTAGWLWRSGRVLTAVTAVGSALAAMVSWWPGSPGFSAAVAAVAATLTAVVPWRERSGDAEALAARLVAAARDWQMLATQPAPTPATAKRQWATAHSTRQRLERQLPPTGPWLALLDTLAQRRTQVAQGSDPGARPTPPRASSPRSSGPTTQRPRPPRPQT